MNLFRRAASIIEHFLQENESVSNKIPLIVILGPTASGKTALSIKLAGEFSGEIISADSRQVYRGMDIGTDKISSAEQKGIPHHLLDVADPRDNFTLADYLDHAQTAVADIFQRGRQVFLVGGTGLYLDALIRGYDLPRIPADPELRRSYETMAEREGNAAVHALLLQKDPEAAAKVHPNNLRYVIRTLEIFTVRNAPKIDKVYPDNPYRVLKIGISRPRDELYRRINRRAETQVERGILGELQSLLAFCPRNANAFTSLGYKEYFPYLDGKEDLAVCVTRLQQNTRNYAKRQLTWFRRDPEIIWLEAD